MAEGTKKSLRQQINEEYALIAANPERGLDKICELLISHLPLVIGRHIYASVKNVDEDAIDEVLQTTMEEIIEKAFINYNEEKAEFATYCERIAVNNSIDYGNEWCKRWNNNDESFTDLAARNSDEEEKVGWGDISSEQSDSGDEFHSNPERVIVKNEFRSICKEWAEKFLNIFVNIETKPYKLVGSGYSIILSKKYPTNDNKNDATSPNWALSQLSDKTVKKGADNFISEVNDWARIDTIKWGPNFGVNMRKEEFGKPISDIVFGEHFDRKSIENWDNSIRNKVRKQLIDTECVDIVNTLK